MDSEAECSSRVCAAYADRGTLPRSGGRRDVKIARRRAQGIRMRVRRSWCVAIDFVHDRALHQATQLRETMSARMPRSFFAGVFYRTFQAGIFSRLEFSRRDGTYRL